MIHFKTMQIRRWKADRAESSEDDAKHLATVFQGNSVFLFQIKMDAYLLVRREWEEESVLNMFYRQK